MHYKLRFFMLVLLALVIDIVLFCALLMGDPLQIVRKGVFYAEKYEANMRFQARGIIENIDFDGVILGSSMLENSSALEAARLVGGRFVNLSLSGANLYERFFLLEYMLKNKNMKNIMFSFDFFAYAGASRKVKGDEVWLKLYDDTLLNDFLAYYDRKYFIKAVEFAFVKSVNQPVGIEFFDRPTAWFRDATTAARFGGLENWVEDSDAQGVGNFLHKTLPDVIAKLQEFPPPVISNESRMVNIFNYINEYFLCVVRDNPNTRFYAVFPPYYRYVYAEMRQAKVEDFALYQKVIEYMVNATALYPNLEVYGFEDMDFLDDIANYKDTGHYSEKINPLFTQAIASRQHMLTSSNLAAYLKKCEELALAFDIRKFYSDALDIAHKKAAAR